MPARPETSPVAPSRRPIAARHALAALAALSLLATSLAGARPSYTFLVPWGRLNLCANCHMDSAGGGPRNLFGTFFEANGFEWTESLAALDSDGDGFTNGTELQDPTGTWIMSTPPPGNVLLVSSPGRSSSVPGERQIVLSEVLHDAASGEFFAEITNTSSAPIPLSQKWLVWADPFLTRDDGAGGSVRAPRGAPFPAEQRLVPFGDDSTIAAGEVRTYFLDRTGLPPNALTADDGFVMLVLFEPQGGGEPDGVDPSLSHTIGDYVQWGDAVQSYTSSAQDNEFLPQWDLDAGLALGVPAGASLEYALSGQSGRDWYRTEPTLTFGVARPVAALQRPMVLAFPVGGLDGDMATPGFEMLNYAPAWPVPARWPYFYGVTIDAPVGAPSSRPGEFAIRLSTNADPARPVGPYLTSIAVGGTVASAGSVRVGLDVLLSDLPASADPPNDEDTETCAIEWATTNGENRVAALVKFTSGVATASLVINGVEASSATLFDVAALDPTGDWVRLEIESAADDVELTTTFTAARRDGSEAVTPVVIVLPIGPPPPDESTIELSFSLPADGFDLWVNGVRTLAPDALRTGYLVAR